MTLELIRWHYKFCWLRNDEYTTTTLLLVEKLSKMNCTHFGQNIHKNNEKWRYLEIFINKKFRHLEKNSWRWKYFKRWSLIYSNILEEQHETLRPNEITPWIAPLKIIIIQNFDLKHKMNLMYENYNSLNRAHYHIL